MIRARKGSGLSVSLQTRIIKVSWVGGPSLDPFEPSEPPDFTLPTKIRSSRSGHQVTPVILLTKDVSLVFFWETLRLISRFSGKTSALLMMLPFHWPLWRPIAKLGFQYRPHGIRKQTWAGITAGSVPILRTDADGFTPRFPGDAPRISCMSEGNGNRFPARSRGGAFGTTGACTVCTLVLSQCIQHGVALKTDTVAIT